MNRLFVLPSLYLDTVRYNLYKFFLMLDDDLNRTTGIVYPGDFKGVNFEAWLETLPDQTDLILHKIQNIIFLEVKDDCKVFVLTERQPR